MAYLYPLLTSIARTCHTFLNVKSVCLKAAMSFLDVIDIVLTKCSLLIQRNEDNAFLF